MATQARTIPPFLGLLLSAVILSACGTPQAREDEPQTDESQNPNEEKPEDGEEGASGDLSTPEDPYLWLEEIQGEKAMSWVEERNEESLAVLQADPEFAQMRDRAREILDATDRIPYGGLRDGHIYNFWRDEEHVRGIWRRTPKEDYMADDMEWEVLVDLDALAEKEGENWVWKGATCLPPKGERCILTLSRGGKDASVQREFDVTTKEFVDDGFVLPEGKNRESWVDQDTLLVGYDSGDESLTESGYPRTLRSWKRGTPLEEAPVVFEVEKEDVSAWPWVEIDEEGNPTIVFYRAISFYSGELTVANQAMDDFQKLPLPDDIQPKNIFRNHLLATLRSPWSPDGEELSAGTLVAIDLKPYLDLVEGRVDYETLPEPDVTALYRPDQRSAVQRIHTTPDAVLVEQLVDVKPRIDRYRYDGETREWSREELPLPSDMGTGFVVSASIYEPDVYLRQESPLKPESLYHWTPEMEKPERLATLPARFDADGMSVKQHRASSADGTEIPYYVVLPSEFSDDPLPTYLYAYGGFEVSMLPYYRPVTGSLWLSKGGIFVVANIRGGGEYGPRWHQAALKENRQKAFDDFHAVAADLIERGYTTSDQLGIRGGSNGGLLMGVAVTQRPDLYGAAIIDVPLLDMLRYHKLLAGASWVGEYGDPDDPKLRDVILAYSPYHNVDPDTDYPRVFITTSTMDDRVHPGHARKMVARMMEQGHDLYYYENTEGGHGGVANNEQRAFVTALKFVYMMRELGLGKAPADTGADKAAKAQ